MYGRESGFGPPLLHANALLQQFHHPNNSTSNDDHDRPLPPDPMHLLVHAQRQQQMMSPPSGHQSMPAEAYIRGQPSAFRPPPLMYQQQSRGESSMSRHDLLRNLQQSQPQGFISAQQRHSQPPTNNPYPPPPPPGLQGFLPSQFPFPGGPRPLPGLHHGGSTFQPSPGPGDALSPPQAIAYGSGQLGAAQQDMLATLFAGLGPRTGAGG